MDFQTGRTYTYPQLKDAIVKVASALTRMGYKKNDVIAVYTANSPEYTILLLACGATGIIATTVSPLYTPGKNQYKYQLPIQVVKLKYVCVLYRFPSIFGNELLYC